LLLRSKCASGSPALLPFPPTSAIERQPPEPEQHKLASILAAEVVAYSRLMGRDESGTLARLQLF
jgi:hypothetical protein